MAKFLVRANYTGDGVKGLMSEGGSKRRDAATAAIESVGGTLDCMYYAFGETDMYAICDMPDNAVHGGVPADQLQRCGEPQYDSVDDT